MRRKLMACLIIVCRHSRKQQVWLRKGAHRPASRSQGCVRLLCVGRVCCECPSVVCNSEAGSQGSQREGLGKGRVGQRMHTQETEKESSCNGQCARRHTYVK